MIYPPVVMRDLPDTASQPELKRVILGRMLRLDSVHVPD